MSYIVHLRMSKVVKHVSDVRHVCDIVDLVKGHGGTDVTSDGLLESLRRDVEEYPLSEDQMIRVSRIVRKHGADTRATGYSVVHAWMAIVIRQ